MRRPLKRIQPWRMKRRRSPVDPGRARPRPRPDGQQERRRPRVGERPLHRHETSGAGMTDLDGTRGDEDEIHQAEKMLGDLRQALMRLHKVLLDWERRGYERIHGRQSSHDMLQVLLSDAQFAWLRPISQLIVKIDEILSEPTPPMRNDVDAIVAAA